MTSDVTGRPSTVRLILGKKLKDARLAAGMELSQLAKFKLGHESTISRIERGKVPVLPFKVVALCKVYGVDQATTDELEALAFRASEETIFDDYNDVIPRWFSIFVHLEASASRILAWEGGEIMPGILQTPAYARAVFEAYRPVLDEGTVARSVTIRQERQRAVFARSEARVSVVLGEGVIARQVGGRDIMAAQLEHLRALGERAQVEIRVLTWAVGAHAAMTGSFTMLEFDGSELGDVAYTESASGATYLDKPRMIPRYRDMFQSVYEQSIPFEEYTP